jgi:PAS domain S-box-containing protein
MEAAVDAIISIDADGIIQTVNTAAVRLFGYAADEMIGHNVNMLMPSPYQEEHDDYLRRYVTTGQKKIIGIGREVLGLKKDGTVFPMDLAVAEARVASERIFVGIIRDITERKQAEKALRDSNEQLATAVAELREKNDEIRAMTQQLWQAAKLASVGEIAAGIAHELNNPLATVCLRIEALLARTPADDPRRRGMEIIEQEAKRMGDLVANLLQFSRRGEDKVSTVDVRQELLQAVDLVQHILRKAQVCVVQELAADAPIIYADRQKLRQVFLNLLTNAADAMAKGGKLTLRIAPTTLHGVPSIELQFIDTGSGVSSEHLAKIMEPFFTTKEEGRGTGLGLAICRRVVQEHQGTIEIESAVGQGTTVRIVLPVQSQTNVAPLRGGDLTAANAELRTIGADDARKQTRPPSHRR